MNQRSTGLSVAKAFAGFLWWGVVAAGFLAFGRGSWNDLLLAIVLVSLIFVLASQPHVAFGITFLLIVVGYAAIRRASAEQIDPAPQVAHV